MRRSLLPLAFLLCLTIAATAACGGGPPLVQRATGDAASWQGEATPAGVAPSVRPTAETPQATATAAPEQDGDTDSLVGTAWNLASYGSTEPRSPVEPGSQITIQFDPANIVSGSAGCNTYTGLYEFSDGGKITFGPLSVTRRPCPEPYDRQESAYLLALEEVEAYETSRGTLRLFYAGGEGILSYVPGELAN